MNEVKVYNVKGGSLIFEGSYARYQEYLRQGLIKTTDYVEFK